MVKWERTNQTVATRKRPRRTNQKTMREMDMIRKDVDEEEGEDGNEIENKNEETRKYSGTARMARKSEMYIYM